MFCIRNTNSAKNEYSREARLLLSHKTIVLLIHTIKHTIILQHFHFINLCFAIQLAKALYDQPNSKVKPSLVHAMQSNRFPLTATLIAADFYLPFRPPLQLSSTRTEDKYLVISSMEEHVTYPLLKNVTALKCGYWLLRHSAL